MTKQILLVRPYTKEAYDEMNRYKPYCKKVNYCIWNTNSAILDGWIKFVVQRN